jgi:mono/diheme cytochrome c family protein
MRIIGLVACVGLLAACASNEHAAPQSVAARGQTLVEANCGACHATGRSGDSPAPEAPALRTLSQNYRVAQLEEALGEGISVGHPAMPAFAFAPDDDDAIVADLQSIQSGPERAQ